MSRRKPEAEHRRSQKGRHQQLGGQSGGAQVGGQLDLAQLGNRTRQAVAM
jgi:hypothetical protein